MVTISTVLVEFRTVACPYCICYLYWEGLRIIVQTF